MRIPLLFFLASLTFLCFCKSNDEKKNTNCNQICDSVTIQENQKNLDKPSDTEGNDQNIKLDESFKSFLMNFKKENLPYQIIPNENLDYEDIPFEMQAAYLLKAEGLDKNELDDMQDYAKFFYVSHPIGNYQFNAIVYARLEMGSIYFVLCTFDNTGKLISYIDFAMLQKLGAGPQAGQEYHMSGTIDKDFLITTKADNQTKQYRIEDDGKIVKK